MLVEGALPLDLRDLLERARERGIAVGFKDLGAGTRAEIPAISPVEVTPREVSLPELEADGDAAAEEAGDGGATS